MNREKGFALIAALWLVVALSSVALGFALHSRDRRLLAANRVESVRARWAAEAGLEHAQAILERRLQPAARRLSRNERGEDPWRTDGLEPLEGSAGNVRYRVRIHDLGARLNINRVDEPTLARFLIAVGLDASRAGRMAQTILDWRDPDSLRRARGAESETYERSEAPRLPTNRAFRAVDELRWVEAVRQEELDRLAGLVTVRGSGRVNLSSAPEAVLLSLPGMPPVMVREILRRRSVRPMPTITDLVSAATPGVRAAMHRHLPELVARTTPDTRDLLLVSDAWEAGSPTRTVIEAVLMRAGGVVFRTDRKVR